VEESRPSDPLLELRADLVRGEAAYERDQSDDLNDSGRALRARGDRLRRYLRELQEGSSALRAQYEQLRRQFERQRRF
jgi:hypothetical protein